MIFAPFCLSAWELYFKFWKTLCEAPLWYVKVRPKPYDDTSYTYAACFCIELCQIVVTLGRILFMLSWSRFMCTPYTPLLCFFEKLALYHPLIPQNKYSTICVGLSLQFLLKKREAWAIEKKYGHMKVQVLKKRKKNVGTWRSMKKKEEEKKIVMLSKEFI